MQIVIEGHYRIKHIVEEYKSKIKSVKNNRREIILINGDVLKFISTDSRLQDGIRADVAIGPNARLLTLRSNQEKRVWGIEDLYNHIESI